eukprot:scpid72440/ scgid25794/ 
MAGNDLNAGNGADIGNTPQSSVSFRTMNEEWSALMDSVEELKVSLWQTELPSAACVAHQEAKTSIILLAVDLARVMRNVGRLLNDFFMAGESGSRLPGEIRIDQEALCDALRLGDVQSYERFQKNVRFRLQELQRALRSFDVRSDSSQATKTECALSSLMSKIVPGTDATVGGIASEDTMQMAPSSGQSWMRLPNWIQQQGGESISESKRLKHRSMHDSMRRHKDVFKTGLPSIEHLLSAFCFLDLPFAEERERNTLQHAIDREWSNMHALWKAVQENSSLVKKNIRCLKKIPESGA